MFALIKLSRSVLTLTSIRDDPEMNKLTVYMRCDHSTEGDIAKQKMAPDAALVTLNGEQTSLTSYLTSLTPKLYVYQFANVVEANSTVSDLW